MNDINSVSVVGRLTKDAELKFTAGGMAVMNFSLAVNRSKKQGNEWKNEASFFNCSAFGKMAEGLHPYMTKGKQIGVQGYLKQETWKDKNSGETKSRTLIGCETLQLLGGNKQQESASVQSGYVFQEDMPW